MWDIIKNVLTIIVAIITVLTAVSVISNGYGTITTKVGDTDKKVDTLKSDVNTYINKFFDSVEGKDGLRSQINKIESKIGTIDIPKTNMITQTLGVS